MSLAPIYFIRSTRTHLSVLPSQNAAAYAGLCLDMAPTLRIFAVRAS